MKKQMKAIDLHARKLGDEIPLVVHASDRSDPRTHSEGLEKPIVQPQFPASARTRGWGRDRRPVAPKDLSAGARNYMRLRPLGDKGANERQVMPWTIGFFG